MAVFQVSCTNEGEECNEVYKEAHFCHSLTPQVNYCCKVDFTSYDASSFLSLSPPFTIKRQGFIVKQNLGIICGGFCLCYCLTMSVYFIS